ncbi:hypothetical protein AMAG_18715 [Allomyces macrogynus ATCC 38327]|uniref:Uncharacterized protein n=1 Tax=Allomyces macrogynus (strain ATCC 38327) TaxID=578462 RepID=A0A0L0SEV9_ALLM3|nr:hypothetical protein AMAG_18715 [Allomyces macrogynus ATCC 38327]|eukprot:KNE60954.1 hypothetical protein AMAG_18715 [Allomyces macrogynus ATCC 38327]
MPHPVLRVLCGTTARDIDDLLAPKARPGATARWLGPSSLTSSLALSTPISARSMLAQLAVTPAAITAQWRQSRALLGALVDAVQYGPASLSAAAATPTQPDALGPIRVAVDVALVRYRRADPASQARTLHNHRPWSVYAVVRDTTFAAPVKGDDGMMVTSPTVETFCGELPATTAVGEGICDEAVSSFAAVTMYTTSSKGPSDGGDAEPVPLAPQRTGNQQHASHAHLVPSATSASSAAAAASKHAPRADLLSAGRDTRHARTFSTPRPLRRDTRRARTWPRSHPTWRAPIWRHSRSHRAPSAPRRPPSPRHSPTASALLVKWYQSPYDEDRKLRVRAEAALTRMSVHVGSVTAAAAVVADDGAGDAAAVVKSVHRLASRANMFRAIMAADAAAAAREGSKVGHEEEEDAAMFVADTAVLLSDFAARAGVAGVRPASPSISGAPLARRRASVAVDRRHPARAAGAGEAAKLRHVDSLRAGKGAVPDVMVTRDDEARQSVPTALDRRPSRVTMALTPPAGMSRTVSAGSSNIDCIVGLCQEDGPVDGLIRVGWEQKKPRLRSQ